MANSIITGFEVVKYSPVKQDYPTDTICGQIKNIEMTLFRECLGIDFYNKLLADIIPYEEIPEYDYDTTYSIGDQVLLDGTLFTSLINSNTAKPNEIAAWEISPKFANDVYQELWENYLRYYLAYMIIYSTINYSTFQAGAKGLVLLKNYQEVGLSTADSGTLWNWKSNVKKDAIDYLENMKYFIRENIEEFPELKSYCGIECSIRRKHRIAFRR